MDKKDKNENIDDVFDDVNEDEINDIIKQAEKEAKEDEEKKKKGIVDTDEKPKKKKKKKKKQKEEESDDDEKEKEEFRKWKEQKKLEKEKKKKKKSKNSDDEEDSDSEENQKKKKSKKKKKIESDEEEEEESEDDDVFEKGFSIPDKVSEKVKSNDLKVVLNLIRKCNLKYKEGIDLYNEGNYEESFDYLKHANSSFTGLNKMIQSNTDAYPKNFRQLMDTQINEKLKSIRKYGKECSKKMKEAKEKTPTNNNYNFTPQNNNSNSSNNQNKPKSLHDKEEDEMDQKIESEIMVKNPKVKFSDIIGMQDMKQILYEIIVVPTIRPDLFTGIRKPQRGILLFGPPGTGKTMIAKAIASECNSTFFNISASSLTSKWVGESEKTVKSLFKIAYKKVPSIIFIDEIDSILSKRSESENEATKRLKTEFLIQFDGLGSNANARLLVIAATNRPMDLDEALLRRLPKRVYCGPLDEDGRFEFIKKVINRVEVNLSDDDIREIAQKTNDYSNSDLMELCREAAYQPVRELTTEQIMQTKKFRPLVKQDLLNAVQKIRGTLSKKVRDELKKWNDQFGGV